MKVSSQNCSTPGSKQTGILQHAKFEIFTVARRIAHRTNYEKKCARYQIKYISAHKPTHDIKLSHYFSFFIFLIHAFKQFANVTEEI